MSINGASSSGDHYEILMGRWCRLVASEFVPWLDVEANADWLEIGCRTGAISEAIVQLGQPGELTGIDPSAALVDFARSRLGGSARFTVAETATIPLATDSVDAAVSGLVINFLDDLDRSMSEVARVVRPGGTAGAFVWDYAGGMQFLEAFWRTAGEIDDATAEFYQGPRFAGWDRARLESIFGEIGTKVESREIVVSTVFANFDDFWQPLLGGPWPAPLAVHRLSEERRAELRTKLRERLPIAANGTISLTARAWAVQCEVS